jgi:hypothetical protein
LTSRSESKRARDGLLRALQKQPNLWLWPSPYFLAQFGHLLSAYSGDCYEHSVDVGFLDPAELRKVRLEPYGQILLDYRGYLQRAQKFPPRHPLRRDYQADVLLNALKVRKHLLRGNHWRASHYLSQARLALIAAIRTQLGQEFYPDRPDHDIASALPAKLLDSLSNTWPQLTDESLAFCMSRVLELTALHLPLDPRNCHSLSVIQASLAETGRRL